jgi:hypothetical protein
LNAKKAQKIGGKYGAYYDGQGFENSTSFGYLIV